MDNQTKIAEFLAGAPHAVVGASRDRAKIGNKVLRAYVQTGRPVFPVNPTADEVEGLKSYPDLASLPASRRGLSPFVQSSEQKGTVPLSAAAPVHGVSVITPPHVTESIVEQAAALGIKHIWLQPGAESAQADARATELGINVISGGPCILVALRYRES